MRCTDAKEYHSAMEAASTATGGGTDKDAVHICEGISLSHGSNSTGGGTDKEDAVHICKGISLSHGNNSICNNMDGPRDYLSY